MKLASPLLRPVLGFVLGALMVFGLTAVRSPSAYAQGIALIRDTEAERVLRGWLDPILLAGGLSPNAVRLHIVNDPSLNAFVAEGQNMFLHTGLLMTLETPNQIMGVMAHETGHMADGHLVRMGAGVRAASVPLLISMAAGIAAMVAGAGDAGMAIMMGGQQFAERTFLAFTRTQESAADQAGMRYLTAVQRSGVGMLEVFRRFQGQEILSARRRDPFAQSHPAPRDRIASLQNLVDTSPYRDIRDSPEDQYALDMLRAKLRGYIERPEVSLRRYPVSDTSKAARYARAMAYFRQPNMGKALLEMENLLEDEPNNPYFLEMYGQIMVEMGRVDEGIVPYRQAVKQMPDAPLIRVALGAAMLGTENPKYSDEAISELEMALRQENGNTFAWYELAQAYGRKGQRGKAELATAERYFSMQAYPPAIQFAGRAQRILPQGSTEWQRAADILSIAQFQSQDQRTR